MAPRGRAGIFCSLPLGMHQASRGALFRNNKKTFRVIRQFRVFRVPLPSLWLARAAVASRAVLVEEDRSCAVCSMTTECSVRPAAGYRSTVPEKAWAFWPHPGEF